MRTFDRRFNESNEVNTAFTTLKIKRIKNSLWKDNTSHNYLTASLGSLLFIEAFLEDTKLSISSINTQTREVVSSAISEICSNSFITNLPDSENHFENKECEFISSKIPLL